MEEKIFAIIEKELCRNLTDADRKLVAAIITGRKYPKLTKAELIADFFDIDCERIIDSIHNIIK